MGVVNVDARLVLGRGPLRRGRGRRRARPWRSTPPAPTSSTSAANRPARAPRRCPRPRRARRVVPVIEALAGRTRAAAVGRHDQGRGRRAPRSPPAPSWSTTSAAGGSTPPSLPSRPRPGAAFVCGHLRGARLAEVPPRRGRPPTFDEVAAELAERLAALPPAMRRAHGASTPGSASASAAAQNLELCRRRRRARRRAISAGDGGPSRKRFLGELTGLAGRRARRRHGRRRAGGGRRGRPHRPGARRGRRAPRRSRCTARCSGGPR